MKELGSKDDIIRNVNFARDHAFKISVSILFLFCASNSPHCVASVQPMLDVFA